MPNPDVSAFVDLKIYDKDAQTILQNALAQAQTDLPTWVPREGNIEMVMLEAFAYCTAELMFAIDRLPSSMLQILLNLYDVYRDYGTAPVVTITFTVQDTAGYTIPAGAALLLTVMDGIQPITFTTDEELAIPTGSSTGSVSATGDQFTVTANALALPASLSVVDSYDFINSAEITALVTEGKDQEDDATYFGRGAQALTALSAALALPTQFASTALENTAVARAFAIDSWNPAAAGHTPGQDPGYVAVAVYGPVGLVSSTDKATVASTLVSRAQANLSVAVVDATVTAVPVTVTVVANKGTDPAQVQADVTNAIAAYLSTETWDWSSTVHRNALISIIGSVDTVAYVQTLTAPSADVTLPGNAPLATTGAVTVTVVSL